MEQYLRVGVITTTHGVRGEVKVFPTTDEPERFLDLERVYLDVRGEKRPLTICSVKFFKNLVIVKFKEYNSLNEVEGFRQCELYIDRSDALPLRENENYIGDLIGLSVVTEDGEALGTLKDVMETGANDVYIVESRKYGEILIPAIHQCILDVDLEKEEMKVHLLPGLLDLNQ